jgi:TonB-dependent receptor
MRNTNVTLQHIAAAATREGTAMKLHPPHSSIALGNSHQRRGFPLQPGLWLTALFLFVFSPFVAHAQQATGDITGRVMNQATGRYLANAVISVDGTAIRALTDDLGAYRITNLVAGTYTVRAAYIDLDSAASTVTVAVGETATADFNLTSEVYVMEAFTVSGEREGAAKALQDQRFSNSMINVVASDSFGNMVDGNIGELMKKLPGVAIDYDGEDPGAMRIRGMPPAMASVTMDGNPIASGGSGNSRAFDLGTFAVQNIDVIELNFAPTPDQPSHNMGGSVNFKTRNAFAQKGRRIRIDGNLSLNTSALDFSKTAGGGRTPDRKLKPGLMFAYSEAFGSVRPFGVSIVANFYQRYRYNNSYTLPGGYTYDPEAMRLNDYKVAEDMQGTIGSVLWQEAGAATERRNLAVNLDWKVSNNTILFFRTSYTQDIDSGRFNHNVRLTAGTHLEGSDFQNIIAGNSTVAVTNSVQNRNVKSFNINLGAEHKFGDFELKYDAYITKSSSNPDPSEYYSIDYTLGGINMNVLDVSGNATGQIVQTFGPDYLDVSNYSRLNLTRNFSYGDDKHVGAKFEIKKPFRMFGVPVLVQAGASFNRQEHANQLYYRLLRLTGNSALNGFGTASEPQLQQFADPYFKNAWNFDLPIPTWLSPYFVYDHYMENPEQFYRFYADVGNSGRDVLASEVGRTMENDKSTTEDMYAGYIMGTVNIASKFTMMAGIRYETTHLAGKGWSMDTRDNPFRANGIYDIVSPTSPYYGYSAYDATMLLFARSQPTKDYDGIFPNVQIKYDITPNLSARAAYTTGMARPNFNDVLWANDRIRHDMKLIQRPNPNLKSQTHDLYQLRLEYYFKKFGSVMLTGFYQDYKDYIYTFSDYEPYYDTETEEESLWRVESKQNIGKGRNYGFEFSYQQRLGFIAKWLERVEFYIMYSWADPKAEYPRHSLPVPVSSTGPVPQAEIDAWLASPIIIESIPLNNIKRRYAASSLSYKGPKFTASVTANWTDTYAQSITNTATKRGEATMYAENIRMDLSLGYRLSRHWEAYFDWRNFTDVPDERSIFNRTGGYYTSGMVMNAGVRANF